MFISSFLTATRFMRRLATPPSSLLIGLVTLVFVPRSSASSRLHFQPIATLQGRVLVEVVMTALLGKALLPGLTVALPLLSLLIAPWEEPTKKLFTNSSEDPSLSAATKRHRSRRSALGITITLFGFLWLTAGAETVAIFAQADVANSTVKGKVTDPFEAAVSGATVGTLLGFLWLTAGAETVAIFAQVDVASSTIEGKVTDQFDAAVSGATVTVINAVRGVVRSVETNSEGAYHVPLLQPGIYDLRVEAGGFQTQLLQKVSLTVGQVVVYDIKLQIGQIKEEVSAGAAPTLIETARTQQSDTIELGQIANLPNLSRNFSAYVFTLSGVSDTEAARVQQTRVVALRTSGFSVGGSNGRSNYISIDGGENDSGTGSLRVRNLSVEAVQEFQVNLNAFAAEYGFTSGTAVNVVTRGGTNKFHGSGYVFYRSEKTAARDPLNLSGQKALERRVVPGFTLGGPLVRNKAFFFTSFETARHEVARVRAYTSNPSLLQSTQAQAAYLQTLETGTNANGVAIMAPVDRDEH